MTDETYGIHWFRRDLRLIGNPALYANMTKHNGRVVGVFFFDSEFLSRPDFSHNRFQFFLNTLLELKKDMHKHGGDLLVLNSSPEQGFEKLFNRLKNLGTLPATCSFNRDYEPYARKRDAAVQHMLEKKIGLEVLTTADHLLIEPDDLRNKSGGYYKIFTPFYYAWYNLYKTSKIQERVENAYQKKQKFHLTWKKLFDGHQSLHDKLDDFISKNKKHVTVDIPAAGVLAAQKQLLKFKKHLADYKVDRDYPSKKCTSNLSVYLKNGSLTTAQVFFTLQKESHAKDFLRQLVWREFYYHILFHYPGVEHESFLEKYKKLKWENKHTWFEAWKEGKTGYPIVDAGMRQLKTTGLMHNRVRMIVASFLTKDLHIDWRWGERWFMQNLLDGDIAANNGGWQWAASTGCDPQPYFRIFNPVLQSQKFDPDGEYIKKYVPELRNLNKKDIHCPSDEIRPKEYPKPIVVHDDQKRKAILFFKTAR